MLVRRLATLLASLLLGLSGLAVGAVPAWAADDGNSEPPPPCGPNDPGCDGGSDEPPPPDGGGGGETPPPPTGCLPGDPFCEAPVPTELGTAADQADDRAATGLGTAADAITAARTRQGR